MKFVVLMSTPENRYGDTPTSYPFPAQYRRFFEPLAAGEPTLAIVYEPRGKGAVRGRQAYVGWAALAGVPRREVEIVTLLPARWTDADAEALLREPLR